MYSRIVVPLDGSELAELALPPAQELATLLHLPVYLVRVLDHMDEHDDTKRYLERIEARLCTKSITVSSEIPRGSPAKEIIAVTKPGDLLVMSTHGRGGLTRFFLGSVAESVVRHADVPVMIVRAGATAGQHEL